jgi:hypothetical protein
MGRIVSRYFLFLVIILSIYLVAISLVGHSKEVTVFFYYGFWLVLGVVLGFRFCVYLYEKRVE